MTIQRIKRKKAISRMVTSAAYRLFKYLGMTVGTLGAVGALVFSTALDTEGDAFRMVISALIVSVSAIIISVGFVYLSRLLWSCLD